MTPMKKTLRSFTAPLPVALAVLGSCVLYLASQTVADQKPDQNAASPRVITTVTPNEAQREDQVRPEFLQPLPINQKATATSLPIKPQDGETIVFLGNSLAARMEHYNYFETSLHQQFPKQQLTFRNMGFPGHTPAFRPEAGTDDPWAFPGAAKFRPDIKAHFGKGHYPSPDEWLTIIKAKTIVAFFGFNESFDGPEGVENFRNELSAFVDHTLSRSYERAETAPRLVVEDVCRRGPVSGYREACRISGPLLTNARMVPDV